MAAIVPPTMSVALSKQPCVDLILFRLATLTWESCSCADAAREHAYASSPSHLAHVRRLARSARPDADVLVPQLSAGRSF
jgi:hypothetical protein